ncbi:MAG: tRNA (adenosine(37)-N6)-threonylcarbamoyltransferase complex dimerization subunit type 1 TsaB [Spirochaetia bacterium]|jgi:tRNA threonylcarbamoyladenosine biosynthesis protein TsaB|nr:tRNA (adenosine(37)-N6)-threonylcarbamoyltransferase complex dimerization subunit type 1 TsaB [Spirochaetia bacterium]
MNILAFDTSTDNLGIALKNERGTYSFTLSEALKHSEKLLPLAEMVLGAAGTKISEIDLLVCAKGPGSFTGLRIGMATVKGMAYALSVPVISVPTLDFLASGYNYFDGAVIPVIDAKKNRFYTAVYAGGSRKSEYLDTGFREIAGLAKKYEKTLLTGPDCGKLYMQLKEEAEIDLKNIFPDLYSNKSRIINCLEMGYEMYKNGEADKDDSGPVYIRKSDAEAQSALE